MDIDPEVVKKLDEHFEVKEVKWHDGSSRYIVGLNGFDFEFYRVPKEGEMKKLWKVKNLNFKPSTKSKTAPNLRQLIEATLRDIEKEAQKISDMCNDSIKKLIST